VIASSEAKIGAIPRRICIEVRLEPKDASNMRGTHHVFGVAHATDGKQSKARTDISALLQTIQNKQTKFKKTI